MSSNHATFGIGETVRVTDGPFANFAALVQHVDAALARLRVAVTVHGRPVPIDVEYGQVEKPD